MPIGHVIKHARVTTQALGRTMVGKGVESGAAGARVIVGGRQVGVERPVT
jgi:hypothetical protein